MSVAEPTPLAKTRYSEPPLTAEEYADQPRHDDVPTELIRGEVVEMTRPVATHGVLCFELAVMLRGWSSPDEDRLVVATNDTGFVTGRSPDTVRGPDIIAIKKSRLPDGRPPDAWFESPAPDLCVEVMSPSNTWEEMLQKAAEFMTAGVQEVWILDPTSRCIWGVHVETGPFRADIGDRVEGRDILPGFALRVADIFEAI